MALFAPINESCYFHFIDAEQPTARSDKPEWFFKYLFDVLEANITQLIEYESEGTELPYLFYEQYCIRNITLVSQYLYYVENIGE
jgi:hypothetical protein